MRSSTLNFTDTYAQSFIVFTIWEGPVVHRPGNKFSEFVLALTEGEHRKISHPEDS